MTKEVMEKIEIRDEKVKKLINYTSIKSLQRREINSLRY
jgi:hypothetical protein